MTNNKQFKFVFQIVFYKSIFDIPLIFMFINDN